MAKTSAIKEGSKVKLDYEGKLETGEIFDSSKHGDHSHPLEFTIGSRQIIQGFEKAVIGLKKGDKREFKIKPEEGYGKSDPKMIQEIPRAALPRGQEPKVGMVLMINTPEGRQFPVRIVKIEQDSVSIDLNHPLAGKTLIFSVEILSVE